MFVSELADDGLGAGEFNRDPVDDAGDVHVLPGDLEDMVPGPFLASILSVVDPGKLVGRDVVRYVQAQARLIAHYQAAYYTGITELAHSVEADSTARSQLPNEYASDELAAAVTKTRRAAQTDVEVALDLHQRLPQVAAALAQGRIDTAKVRVFTTETLTLDPALIPTVITAVIGDADELTTGQLRARLKKAVLEADTEAAQTQYEAGLEDRKLVVYPNPDHTATLTLSNIAPEHAIEISNGIHARALELKRLPGETRTIDQLKTDIAVDLLKNNNSRDTSGPAITIEVSTEQPTAHVPGYGPILPTSLHTLIQQADKTTVTTANTTDGTITTDCHQTNARQPTREQTEHIRIHYPTCIHPGCRMPATRCDLDHRRPWHQGGKTTCTNLAPLCRHHHICKDQGGWKLQRNPDGGHTFTSPLGHTYATRAPP